ncbi:FecR family protein [Roseateles sp.]|uniref:FecR family protein n=1 Tax=Roseateles sp. TaxID=1971397 RepID=UPI0039EAB14E
MPTTSQDQLIEQALGLIVRQDGGAAESSSRAAAALGRWRSRSQEHEAAAAEAERLWAALGGMGAGLRERFDEPAHAVDDGPRRRKLLLSLVGAAGTGAAAFLGLGWYREQPLMTVRYDTGTAQHQSVSLNDGESGGAGSRLLLGARTRLAVRLYRRCRLVELDEGEVRFEVAHDAHRPFQVLTRDAAIEVVGTVFTVRDRGGPVTVGVERGHVRVRVRQAGESDETPQRTGQFIDLLAGQELTVRDRRPQPVRRVDPAALSAWSDGWLNFDGTPLGEALATVNAYRPRAPIRADDPRVAALRLTGRFRAADSDALLASLPLILPVTIAASGPDGSVELRPLLPASRAKFARAR